MHTPLRWLIVFVAVSSLGGCAAAPVVRMRTTADPSHAFAPPPAASVNVEIWRLGESESDKGAIVPAGQLTLEERNFRAGVENGLTRAGFEVTSGGSAAYIVLASMDTASGMRDTYRRVPVMESTSGFYHSHHGMRTYSATTSTDYIVPERRPYVHRIITLSAIPSSAASDTAALNPECPGVVWRGSMVSDADVIDAGIAQHVAALLDSWGATSQRDVKWKRESKRP